MIKANGASFGLTEPSEATVLLPLQLIYDHVMAAIDLIVILSVRAEAEVLFESM